jgi:hypothetical protein
MTMKRLKIKVPDILIGFRNDVVRALSLTGVFEYVNSVALITGSF